MTGDDISDKVARILSEKFHEIRKDISAKEIMEKVSESLKLSGVSMNVSGVNIDISMVADLFQKYNDTHKERILELANSVGLVVTEEHAPDDDHVLVKTNDIRISIAKDVALKIVALGFVPDA